MILYHRFSDMMEMSCYYYRTKKLKLKKKYSARSFALRADLLTDMVLYCQLQRHSEFTIMHFQHSVSLFEDTFVFTFLICVIVADVVDGFYSFSIIICTIHFKVVTQQKQIFRNVKPLNIGHIQHQIKTTDPKKFEEIRTVSLWKSGILLQFVL